jgi:hypothetical protein
MMTFNLKVVIEETVDNEVMIGRKMSKFMPKEWRGCDVFTDSTKFLSWYRCDANGLVVEENISSITTPRGTFNLPVACSKQFEDIILDKSFDGTYFNIHTEEVLKKHLIKASEEMNIVKGKMFIIPNRCSLVGDEINPLNKKHFITLPELYTVNGVQMKFDTGEQPVQVWFHNEDVENFQDHSGLKVVERSNIPMYLPKSQLEAVMEGDEVVLESTKLNVRFELTAQQLGYRYARFGTFEKTVAGIA